MAVYVSVSHITVIYVSVFHITVIYVSVSHIVGIYVSVSHIVGIYVSVLHVSVVHRADDKLIMILFINTSAEQKRNKNFKFKSHLL